MLTGNEVIHCAWSSTVTHVLGEVVYREVVKQYHGLKWKSRIAQSDRGEMTFTCSFSINKHISHTVTSGSRIILHNFNCFLLNPCTFSCPLIFPKVIMSTFRSSCFSVLDPCFPLLLTPSVNLALDSPHRQNKIAWRRRSQVSRTSLAVAVPAVLLAPVVGTNWISYSFEGSILTCFYFKICIDCSYSEKSIFQSTKSLIRTRSPYFLLG